jgi:hypothetical protein
MKNKKLRYEYDITLQFLIAAIYNKKTEPFLISGSVFSIR